MARKMLVVVLLVAVAGTGGALAQGASFDWLQFDADGDGSLSKADAEVIFQGGIWHPKMDINGDGAKDSQDAFALMLTLTRWDRNADTEVNAEDFVTQEPLSLPEPDIAAATALRSRLLVEATAKLPVGQEERLMQEWPTFEFLPRPEQAALLEEAGMLALVEHNLEVAQWAFARSCELDPARASALSDLGYTLCEQDRGEEALVLLSRARQMEPLSAATSSNIGWVFARRGQEVEAARFYREAIGSEPTVAQYQINLGAVLLRQEDSEGAKAAFAQAAALSPGDREALMMSAATNPARPAQMAAYRAEYEKYREETNREYEAEGMDPAQPSWEDLPTSDKIDELIRQESERMMAQRDAALANLTELTKQRLQETVEPVLPKGVKATEDWQRFWRGYPHTFKTLQVIIADGDRQACSIATDCQRRIAAAVLSLDQTILQLALTQAQADMVGYQDGDDARHAFEQTVDDLYEQRMRWAADELRNAQDTAHLDLSPVDREALEASVIGWMPIPIGAMDPVYGEGFQAEANPNPLDAIGLKMDEEPAFGLSAGLVGVEWKPGSNEWKLQAGQGIIVAGTWSPKRGFGFQAGVGVSVTQGSFKVSAANYVKFGSDGSISVDYKVSGGLAGPSLGTKWGGTVSTPVCAATHEPIGTW